MDKCVFCSVISGKLPGTFLYRDDDVVVIKDIHPQASVHLLVLPTKHVSEFISADDTILSKMLTVMKKIIKVQGITRYRIVSNGKGAALIDHLHFHVMGGVAKFRKL